MLQVGLVYTTGFLYLCSAPKFILVIKKLLEFNRNKKNGFSIKHVIDLVLGLNQLFEAMQLATSIMIFIFMAFTTASITRLIFSSCSYFPLLTNQMNLTFGL